LEESLTCRGLGVQIRVGFAQGVQQTRCRTAASDRLQFDESQIATCIPLTGDERLQCWADLDKYLMEDVVPWVPYLFDNDVVVVSANVTNYAFDQFAGLPALDRLAVATA
jgi:hypothetical protein